MLTIACVLKTGGDYTPIYVEKLCKRVRMLLSVDHRFVCLTDADAKEIPCDVLKLKHDYAGWWSKVELFRLRGPVIFFDLDTIILKDFAAFANYLLTVNNFFMLKPFNPVSKLWASGIMAWNGDFKYIYDEFTMGRWTFYLNDQNYISFKLGQHADKVEAVQSYIPGIYSYKRHLTQDVLPLDASIICFHGKPRPIDVRNEWCDEYWGR